MGWGCRSRHPRGSLVDSIVGCDNLASIPGRFNDLARALRDSTTKGDCSVASIGVGAAAPDFTVFAPPGEADFTLSEHRGRPVVLMFVPLAFTSTCTAEFCHIAENWGQWGRLGADVVGISVDSPFVNRKWGEEMGAPFPILSDFNKDAAAAYGVLSEEVLGLRGVAKRSVFVVDGEGRITYAWVSENPGVLPPFDEIVDAARAAA